MTPTRPFRPELSSTDRHALGLEKCRMPGCRTCSYQRAREQEAISIAHSRKGPARTA